MTLLILLPHNWFSEPEGLDTTKDTTPASDFDLIDLWSSEWGLIELTSPQPEILDDATLHLMMLQFYQEALEIAEQNQKETGTTLRAAKAEVGFALEELVAF